MPNYRYTCAEDRIYTQIVTVLNAEEEPAEFTAHDALQGDVIEAAVNPDESRFEETTDPVALVPRPGDEPAVTVEETAAQKKARVAAEKKAQAAWDALSEEDKAALAALTPDELAALQAA